MIWQARARSACVRKRIIVRPDTQNARGRRRGYAAGMRYLVVTDEPWVRNEVRAALSIGDVELIDHDDPGTAAETALATGVDAVIVDLQVASMGGMAVARAVRGAEPEQGALPVVLLLDRAADLFLAGRAGANGWVVKPFTAAELREALEKATRQPAT